MATKAITKPDVGQAGGHSVRSGARLRPGRIPGTDVQEIADRAGVGKGTVYRYFGDKQELFWDTVFWVLDKLDRHLARQCRAANRPLEKLRAAVSGVRRVLREQSRSTWRSSCSIGPSSAGTAPPAHRRASREDDRRVRQDHRSGNRGGRDPAGRTPRRGRATGQHAVRQRGVAAYASWIDR